MGWTLAKRRKAAKKAWRTRKREGAPHKCAFCGKPIWARGVRHGNRWYHKRCWVMYQVNKAVRGR